MRSIPHEPAPQPARDTSASSEPASGAWRRAANAVDVTSDQPHGHSSRGVELVLGRNRAGRVWVFEGRCPHQGALLAEGRIEGGTLVCRNHGWRFDLETGRREGGSECLRACSVREEGGALWVETSSLLQPALSPASGVSRARRPRELPGPPSIPLLGNSLAIDFSRFHSVLERWASVYGDVYQVQLGPRRGVVVANRALGDHVLRERPQLFRRFDKFESVSRELGVLGLFAAEGDTWRSLRKPTVDVLSNRRLQGFYPILKAVAERIERRWARHAAEAKLIDIRREFESFTVDVTAWLTLGRDVNTVEGKEDVIERRVREIFPLLHGRVVAPFPYWRLLRLPRDRRLESAVAEVRAWVDSVVAETRARMDREPSRAAAPASILEALLLERDSGGRAFSSDVLFGSAMTMLVAGQDTTSNVLAWTVHHLCRDAEARRRLRAEADRVLGGARVPESLEQARGLDYAAAAVNEAMRLRPVAPLLYLEAAQDTLLGDIALPRGSLVILLTRASQRQGRFGAAAEFRPERWLDAERGSLEHDVSAHVPFGSGPRLCPGRSLALLEGRVVLATLFRNFDVECDGAPVTERYTSLMVPSNVSVRLRARTS